MPTPPLLRPVYIYTYYLQSPYLQHNLVLYNLPQKTAGQKCNARYLLLKPQPKFFIFNSDKYKKDNMPCVAGLGC